MTRILYLHGGENEPTVRGLPDYTKPWSEGGGEATERTVADVLEEVVEKLGIAFHGVKADERERVKGNFEALGDRVFLAHSGQNTEDGTYVVIDGYDGRKLMYTMIQGEADLRTIVGETGFFRHIES